MGDTLFLLKHDFPDGPGAPFYCPECALISGVLHYYPQLRHSVDVRYVDFPRPRSAVIALVGEANQGCPVAVLGDDAPSVVEGVKIENFNGRRFINGAEGIGNYFATVYGTGRPH